MIPGDVREAEEGIIGGNRGAMTCSSHSSPLSCFKIE